MTTTIDRLALLTALYLYSGWRRSAELSLMELATWIAVGARRPEAKA